MTNRLPSSPTSSWAARALAACTIAFGVSYACTSETGSGNEPPDETRGELLQASATCVLEMNEELTRKTAALVEQLQVLSESPRNTDSLEDAQETWSETMATWQRLELAQFGPAGPSSSGSVGTQDLRDEIYSWRLTNTCRIDQGLVGEVYKEDISAQPINARGLDAIEHLLFSPIDKSDCNALVDIIADGTLEALDDLPERRAAYALAVAKAVDASANQLRSSWLSEGGHFERDFVDAGNAGPYESQGQAFDALITALMYVDTMVKDEKLGAALGLFGDCAEGTCPDQFEHLPSGSSKRAIEKNIESFNQFWSGCGEGATGVDSLLRQEGHGQLADQIDAALEGIEKALVEIEETDLVTALSDDANSVEALYDAVKVLTDLLKSDFVEALQVELKVVAGDND